MLSRDLLGIAQVINRCVRDNDQIDLLQFGGLHGVARTVVEKRIDQDPSARRVNQFVSGDTEEAELGGGHGRQGTSLKRYAVTATGAEGLRGK